MADTPDTSTESVLESSEQAEHEHASAIFGALMGGVEDKKPDNPEGEGKETPGDESENGEAAGDKDGSSEAGTQDDDRDLGESIELEGFKASLKRAGLTETIIGRLTPAEIRELGSHQKKIQSDFDRVHSERGELQKQLEQLDDETMTAEDFDDPDLRKLAEVDLEAAKSIQRKLVEQERSEQEREVRVAMETAYSMLDDLTESYPQLSDSAVKAKVLRTATALSEAGAFEDLVAGEDLMETALERACSMLFTDKTKLTAQAQLMDRADKQRAGQVDDGGPGNSEVIEDPDKWAYDQLRDPNSTLTPQQIAEKREKLIREGKAKRQKLETISF